MADKKDKYIVIKKKDLRKLIEDNEIHGYTRYDEAGRVDIKDEKLQADIDAFGRIMKLLEHNNEYLVVNTNQPYAESMWQILLAFEDLKEVKGIIERPEPCRYCAKDCVNEFVQRSGTDARCTEFKYKEKEKKKLHHPMMGEIKKTKICCDCCLPSCPHCGGHTK